MRNQSIRLVLYSSVAIFLLALAWGIRQIPAQGHLAEEAIRTSVDQEMIMLGGAVKSSTQALKYRLLDVLKAEGGEHTSRTFQNSDFTAVTLLEWDQVQWKSLWYSSKSKTDLQSTDLQTLIKAWPLSQLGLDEVFYAKVNDVQGQAFFAIAVPVRRPNQVPMIGVGVFPANQFGLIFAADQNREVRVFDTQGAALALSHPAYLGASLKNESLVRQMLESDEASLRREWKDERGQMRVGIATRVPESNLIAEVETELRPASGWMVQAWAYLLLCALGAAAVNWYLFSTMLKPLLQQLTQSDVNNEALRKQNQEIGPRALTVRSLPVLQGDKILPHSALPQLDFLEKDDASGSKNLAANSSESPAATTLAKTVQSSLRSLQPKIKEHAIEVLNIGLEEVELQGDSLQLQTAIEEVLKNAIEAMTETNVRNLTITGRRRDDAIVLTIEDSGLGVSAGDVDKVFDPFFSTKDSEGVSRGLGLNVVRRVVEELGGRVKLTSHQSPEQSGTRVEMEWPAISQPRMAEPLSRKTTGVVASTGASVQPPVAAPLATAKVNPTRLEENRIDLLDGISSEDFSVDQLAAEILNAPLRPARGGSMVRRPKVVRTLD